jgi:hypothetical protein
VWTGDIYRSKVWGIKPLNPEQKIYKYYTTTSKPPHNSIGYALYIHGFKKKPETAKRQVIFKIDKEKLNLIYRNALSRGKSKDELLEEMIDYYFSGHK